MSDEKITQELKDRAAKVGYHVDDTRADDGTYWIPSIGRWRSIEHIECVVTMYEE